MAYITRVQIEQCRNVRDFDVDLSVPAAENGTNGAERPSFRHLILTGPNGSGKSGVLEAAVLSLTSPRATEAARADVLGWNVAPDTLATAWREGELLLVYLRARRQISQQSVAGPSKLEWQPLQLLPGVEVSGKLLQFLVNKHTEMAYAAAESEHATVVRLQEWFIRFEKNLQRLMEDDGLSLVFERRAFNFRFRRSDGYTFDINTLADGHAAVISILAELLMRVEVIREARNDFTFEPEGVVIVDEIEAHLHLSLQEQILPFLTELFPRFQFIVATHSPAVIASIPNAVVYDLKKREATLSDHYRGIRYGMLMTEHFGISSEIDVDTTGKLRKLRELSQRPSPTPEDEHDIARLSSELLALSPAMAVEIWAIKERLGATDAAGGSPR